MAATQLRARVARELERPPTRLERLDASEQRTLRDLLRRAASE